MQLRKRLTKNTGFVLASNILNRAFSFFSFAYAARVLGPGDFGLYALIGTIGFVFSSFGNFGIAPMAVREISRDRSKALAIFNHIMTMRVTIVVMTYPLLVLAVNLLGYEDRVKHLVYIACVTSILSTFSGSFRILYAAFERFEVPSLITILVSFLRSLSNIVVLYLGYGLLGLVLVPFFGTLMAVAISGVWVRRNFLKYRLSFDLSEWKSLLAQSMPFAALTFFQQANKHMNILLLSKVPGPLPPNVAMGYYNPSASLGRLAMMFPGSFREATLPTVSSNSENTLMIKKIIEKSTRALLVLVICPMVLATTFFADEIMVVIFGSSYAAAAPALMIFGWGYALQVFNAPVTLTISASRDIKRFIPWAALMLCVNLLIAVPLIYYFSFLGAAGAFLASKTLETLLRNYLLRTICGIDRLGFEDPFYVRTLAPMAAIFVVVFLAGRFMGGAIVPVALATGMYAAFALRQPLLRQGFGIFTDLLRTRRISHMRGGD